MSLKNLFDFYVEISRMIFLRIEKCFVSMFETVYSYTVFLTFSNNSAVPIRKKKWDKQYYIRLVKPENRSLSNKGL